MSKISKNKDFLSTLRISRNQDSYTSGSGSQTSHVYLQISPAESGATLALTSYSGALKYNPSDITPVGKRAPLVKALRKLSMQSDLEFAWNADDDSIVFNTSDYPFLASFIHDWADWIIDKDGNPLQFSAEPAKVVFSISEDPSSPIPILKGAFSVDGKKVLAFVSESIVLLEGELKAVASVGDRFADFHAFSVPFEKELTESFLSIFFSTVQNVDVDFGGRRTVFLKEPLNPVSNLIFEKVDSDNSLYLRMVESLGNLPMTICENFRIEKIASVTDKEIFVRPSAEIHYEENFDILMDAITKNVSRKEAKQIWKEDSLVVVPPDIASKFLYNSFAGLLTHFRILGAEKLKSYKIVAATPKLSLNLGSGIDFLEGKASVDIAGQEFTLNDLLSQYGKNRYVTLSDGNRAVMDEEYMKKLQRIFRNKKGKNGEVSVSFFDLPEIMDLLDEKEKKSKSFEGYRKFYEGFNALASQPVETPMLKAKLRDYQKDGLKWIDYLYSNKMGGCLADDMGLGKTVQTIAMLTRSVKESSKPTMIVMPRSLIFNWQEELKKFAPSLKVTTHYGTGRNLEDSLKGDILLTTYAIVRQDIEQLMKVEFDYVVLDESQNIKNVDALMTKAVWLLKADHKLALSGTPIENNLTELYSLFHFLNPSMFGSLQDFNAQYVTPIQKEGDEDAASALRRKVFPFILRRLKKDVLNDLPERTDQVLMVDMSPRQQALYEKRRRYFSEEVKETFAREGSGKASFLLLQALTELRQIASVPEEKSDGAIASPKIEMLMEYLTSAVKNGHKVVVFFNFLAGIELTAERLEQENIGYEIITGATRDRKSAVDRFQNDDDCRVMLMTVKTGGVGLNLVAADTVFIMEPWWNKAAEEQAINRLHRIGQKNSVNCYYMITADSIEEKIRLLQQQKTDLVDSIISSDSSGAKNLSPDDISFLLG